MRQNGSTLLTTFLQRPHSINTDNNWHGNDISSVSKDPSHTRLMFHNVRHLPLHGNNGLEMFIQEQSLLQTDIQAFSEHCLDTTKFTVFQTAKDILRRTYQEQSTIQLNSSSESAQNHYKPGGTGILVLGKIASRLEPNGKGGDSLGRWSFIQLRRKNLPNLVIISVYQVCPKPTNLLGNTAYHQQQRALNSQGRNVHPRKAFIADLSTLIQTYRQKDYDVIVGGDFNESLLDKNSGVLHLATANNLVDPFVHRFPHAPEFGTHINGRRRIDITLVTPRILTSIANIGYAPFDYASISDHRPLILDLQTNVLFGNEPVNLAPAINRGVKSKDLQSVQTFIHHTYDYIQQHHGFEMRAQLNNDTATPQLLELLDSMISQSEDLAEQRCRRRRPEYYSRTIVQQRLEVSMLKHHLNALQLGRNRSRQLVEKMKRTGVFVPLPETQQLTRQALQSARSRLQNSRDNSFQIRQTELDERIQAVCGDNEAKKAKILKAIKKVENGQRMYRTMKAMKAASGPVQKLDRVEIPYSWPQPGQPVTSITQLEDPKTSNEWRLITDPQEIEYYLMLRNRLHFGQAEGTPFTASPLNTEFDWPATSNAADQVLGAAYVSHSTYPQCAELLKACKARAVLDSISPELTKEEFRGKIRTWRETTTTSPSGRHLGRYKALFTTVPEDTPESDSDEIPLAVKQEEILQLKLSLINYCIRNTYTLNRWKNVVNVMIFKDPGNYKIHRLRVIHIYEADFNAILAIKWRQLLHFATNHGLINEGQYGGRPGCEAQSLTLFEELKYDLAYLTRRTLFNFDNDATSCYDRIIVPLASIVNRKFGMHRRIVAIHAETLRQAQFRLKTASGTSDLHYSHCLQFPIHGTGQGSGNSPCIWLFISSTLFDIHQAQAHGARFVSPDGTNEVRISMVGFVDDSNGSCNDFQPATQATLDQLFHRMESDAQLWNDLLYCTGGKLELQKCSFHVLHFEFLSDGRPRPSLERHDDQIHIRDAESQTHVPIPSKRSFESHRTLGHQKSPYASSFTTDLKDLQKNADRLALAIAMCPTNREGARLAYHTIFIPSVKYTLPQSFFPRNSLEQAQTSSIGKIIAKCGLNRNTARALIYAPLSYAGGGFMPWHLLQGEGQILHFIKHWRSTTFISSTLRLAVQWTQWQSGHYNPVLEDVRYPLPYLECRWIRSLRMFLQEINGSLKLDDTYVARPEREHDVYIMHFAKSCNLFNDQDLAIINYCRLHLHITTISEMFDADGETLIQPLFNVHREAWFNPATYVTLQPRPSDYHIRTKWQRLCRQWITSEGKLAASMRLGNWKQSGETLRRRRETYIATASPRQVYHWHQGSYWEYRMSAHYPQLYCRVRPTHWTPTTSCTPITACHQPGGNILVRQILTPPPKPIRDNLGRDFSEHVETLAPWARQLLRGIKFHLGPYEIIHLLTTRDHTKEVYLVSDGSQQEDKLSFGWVFGNNEGEVYAEHSGPGFGTPTSHRAEAWGMLSAILFLQEFQRYTNLQPIYTIPLVTAFTDNSGLIQRIEQRTSYTTAYPNTTLLPDWDLIEQIHVVTQSLMTKVEYAWVKGHQDETNNETLDTAAKYNIRADELAGEYQHPHANTNTQAWMLPAERCRFEIDKKSLQGHYVTEIRDAYTLPSFFAYLQQRHQWDPEVKELVDWKVFSRAAKNASILPTQLLKLVHDKLPTRHELAKSNPHTNPTCRHCQNRETFTHILQCHNPISQKFRKELIEQLQTFFHTTGTPGAFSKSFLQSAQYWLALPPPPDVGEGNKDATYQEQSRIGWTLFPKGFLSTTWRKRLDQAKRETPMTTKCNSIDFMARLIQLLWKAQLVLWNEHVSAEGTVLQPTSVRSVDKLNEYRTRIRYIQELKPKCLHSHREQYFHQDVEQFLQTATNTQMREYLRQYEPAIRHSVKEASRISLRSLFTFTGFTRRPQRGRSPLFQLEPRPPNRTSPTPARGETLPHKHTRWKSAATAVRTLRDYFLNPQPN